MSYWVELATSYKEKQEAMEIAMDTYAKCCKDLAGERKCGDYDMLLYSFKRTMSNVEQDIKDIKRLREAIDDYIRVHLLDRKTV